jgi:hypothetical protein
MVDRSFEDYYGTVNVRDYGATGDGTTDDTAAIQSAIDECFGSAASPNGNGLGYLNKPLFFPPGRYRTTEPLVFTDIWGGKIIGSGKSSTLINYGPADPEAVGITDDEGGGGEHIWSPALFMNGVNFTQIEGISIQGQASGVCTSVDDCLTVGIWWGPVLSLNGTSNAHGNIIINCSTYLTDIGVLHGSADSAANSENSYHSFDFSGHAYGMFCSGANTLNIQIYGGGIGTNYLAGLKTNNSATISIIDNPATDNNHLDFDIATSSSTVIRSVRSESYSFLKTGASSTVLENCSTAQRGGTATGSTSGTTLTVSALGTIPSIKPGMAIYGTDGVDSLVESTPTRILRQLTGSAGSTGTYELSAAASPGNIAGGTTFTIRPVFCEIAGNGSVTMISCGSAYDPVIISADNSTLRLTNNQFFDQIVAGAISPDLLKFFKGFLLEYDVAAEGEFVVAGLPTAKAGLKGLRMFVTDSNAAYSDTTVGDTVASGGAHAVPVFCNGTNWVIG